MYHLHPVKLVNVIRDNMDLDHCQEVSVFNDLNNAFNNPKIRVLAKESSAKDFTIRVTQMNKRFDRVQCEILYDLINA